ncbi:hypothetical protein ACFQ5J_05655 [Lacticaseibacillus baoqingensis]|uniref:FtsX-like permease family protein n=1 Tax=Lacticaseibacillus baoqingensis TaxID=2486013 RepID=A0ABW4E8C9_9LACO|nr:hypothetical protein [Lacticaseibacillus baoqingensis]
MRFMERAIKALGYHRRAYLGGLVGVFFFSLLSLILLTAQFLNRQTQNAFTTRLQQFDSQTLTIAQHLVKATNTAYSAVSSQYQLWWWGLLAALFATTAGCALVFAFQRRQETLAYLLVGKSTTDVVAQYVLENLIIFTGGYLLAWCAAMLGGTWLDHWLHTLNLTLFEQHLTPNVSVASFQKVTKQLFAHRLTDFSGNDLMFPQRGMRMQPATLVGCMQTYLCGAGALIVSQALTYTAVISLQRHRLLHQD